MSLIIVMLTGSNINNMIKKTKPKNSKHLSVCTEPVQYNNLFYATAYYYDELLEQSCLKIRPTYNCNNPV